VSARRPRIVWPGTGRMTLILLVIVPAAMAYPWQSTTQRWMLGIAAAVVVLLLAWWRGRHLTGIAGRRMAMLRGRDNPGRHHASTTVALRILDETADDLPLAVLAGYLRRYGLACDAVRVTSRDVPGQRTTWVGLTYSVASNLAALQARSEELPLRETAEVALRRLADHLREIGWSVSTAQPVEVPDLLGPQAKERWRAVEDGPQGYVAAYGIAADVLLGQTLEELWALSSSEKWTVLEITGTPERLKLAVACAIRTDDMPGAAPLPALEVEHGDQWTALAAIDPLSVQRLVAQQVPADRIPGFSWPAGAEPVRT
jgi:type VII secretion protein EccE